MDIGGDGRLYVASWRGGEASVYVGPQVGFLACVAPPGLDADRAPRPEDGRRCPSSSTGCAARTRPRASTASARSSVAAGRRRRPAPSPTWRPTPPSPCTGGSRPSSRSSSSTAPGRTASCGSSPSDAAVREFALRALADRKTELDGVDAAPVRRGAGRPLAPGPGAGRDRARAPGGRVGGREPHPPDLAPRGLADADDEAGECPARPGPGRAPPGDAGAGLAPRGGRLPGRDRRPPSRGGPPRLAVDARAEGRRGAHQEAGHGPLPRGAPRHPGHAGAPLSPRGGLRRELVGHPARHDRPVLRPPGVGVQRADRLGPQGGRPRRRRRDRDVPPRRARPAARPPRGAAGRLGDGPAEGRGGDPRRHRQGRPEEPGPDRQHALRGRGEAGPRRRRGTRSEARRSSPPSRAAPATPTPTARRPRGRTWWTSASATAPPSWWSRS